ncbi:MAG: hypothetical protein MZV49_02390 [Rhodopseudomonas palustris]|nr:hypothetical protein [Rhodopseudomonas palustris]
MSAVGALVLAILVSQSSGQDQHGQMVSADLARQAQQIQRLTKGPDRAVAARRRDRNPEQRSRPAVHRRSP